MDPADGDDPDDGGAFIVPSGLHGYPGRHFGAVGPRDWTVLSAALAYRFLGAGARRAGGPKYHDSTSI